MTIFDEIMRLLTSRLKSAATSLGLECKFEKYLLQSIKGHSFQFYIMSTYYLAQFGITLSASEIFVKTRRLKRA